MLDTTRPEPLRSPFLDRERENGVKHGFFTRAGGVSTGLYEGLNVGYGSSDLRETVTKNRKRVAEWLGVETDCLLTAHQVHSPHAIIVDEPFAGDRPEADALVTNQPGLALGALAADCGPILFSDGRARVIAAAHAGWKGALTGVLENTIAAMELLGAERETITAVLGPSISQENYEVGPEFIERFVSHNPANRDWFRPSEKAGHALFDLNGYTVARLTAAGVNATQMGRCTYDEEEHFYSYRRATHRGEKDYGRQISAIILEDI